MSNSLGFLYSDPSGAGTNTDPAKSLGGAPSNFPINGSTIFANVSDSEANSGSIHYRCIYVVNDDPAYNVYSASLSIINDVAGGASVSLGFKVADEIQAVTLTNFSTITGGFLDVVYTRETTYPLTVNWNATPSTFATNFKTQLNSIDGLEDVNVTASYDSGLDIITFQINFIQSAGSRYHELLDVQSTNITYTGSMPIPDAQKEVNGSPINTETVDIDSENTTPNGITFNYTTFNMNTFRGLDVLPVWIRRIVPSGTSALKNDGFTLRAQGTSIP